MDFFEKPKKVNVDAWHLQEYTRQGGMEVRPDDSILSYLPMAHIFGRVSEEFAIACGAAIGYWQVRFCPLFLLRARLSLPRVGMKNTATLKQCEQLCVCIIHASPDVSLCT